MTLPFVIAAAVAVAATGMVITRIHAVHALLYLIVSLLSVAVIFFLLSAPFVAGLEMIIYAGAIMVLFVFAVMMLNQGPRTVEQERSWLTPGIWKGPAVLSLILLTVLIAALAGTEGGEAAGAAATGPKEVSLALYGPYLLAVELGSLLLLPGLIGAYHLGRRAGQSGART